MNVNTAENILQNKIDTNRYKINRVSETNNYFVFEVVGVNDGDTNTRLLIPAYGVNKNNGFVVPFNPIQFVSEMKSIKRIR